MKRVLFDQQIFRNQNFGGISRYFTELITGIGKRPGYLVLPRKIYSGNVYLSGNNISSYNFLKRSPGFKGKRIIEKLIIKWENHKTISRLKSGAFEVFHPTYYDPYFLKYIHPNKPFVLTVHDMIHENYHDNMYEYQSEETKHKIALIPRAAHIIAVSQFTKAEILKRFPGIDEKKISVIYHGTSLHPQIGNTKPAGLPEKYLLYVGIKKHYKNFFWLAESLKDYLKQNNITLLCAGGFDFDGYENDFLSRLGLQHHVRHIPVHSDGDIIALYQNAACFIFPSLAEGFGMPILEAFACGCPVLLSNSSCFPEIAGDAALYFEPRNKAELLAKTDMLCNDEAVRQNMIKKGAERVKMFSWETTVDQHTKIYESLINKTSAAQNNG